MKTRDGCFSPDTRIREDGSLKESCCDRSARGEEIVSNLLNASGTMAILIGIRERKIIELASDF